MNPDGLLLPIQHSLQHVFLSEDINFSARSCDCSVKQVFAQQSRLTFGGQLDGDGAPLGALAFVNRQSECRPVQWQLGQGDQPRTAPWRAEERKRRGTSRCGTNRNPNVPVREPEGVAVGLDDDRAAMWNR